MSDTTADSHLTAEIGTAYRQLRAEIEALIASNSENAADSVLSLVFDRLVTDRPAYFRDVLDKWGSSLVDRDIRDSATFRLLFGAVIGQSPLNGTPASVTQR
jgi:hypothetical protein